MRYGRSLLVAAIVLVISGTPKTGHAVNSLVIESKQVSPGATGVTIGGYVTNDVQLFRIEKPVEFRTVSGNAFMANSFAFNVQGRVAASGLTESTAEAYFADPDPFNTCSGPVSQSYSDFELTPVGFFTSPDAMTWAGERLSGSYLQAGTDGTPGSGTPSFVYQFDVTSSSGEFEIDTCCAVSGHLTYLDQFGISVPVDFTKGVVQIGTPCNSIPWTDVNCDGVTNVFDVVLEVDVAFRGATDPGPCCYGAP